jgi:hypothetical protein
VVVEENGAEESVHFEGDSTTDRSTLYAPGAPAFSRLVTRIVATGVHDIQDVDQDPTSASKKLANNWASQFGSAISGMEVREVRRHFEGTALVRVRAHVAHDSYERLVEVSCSSDDQNTESSRSFIAPLGNTIDDPRAVGLSGADLAASARLDDAISEFCRFYSERRELETQAAGDDERKRRKLDDEFTPRLEMGLVGLQGKMHRVVGVLAKYKIDDAEYSSPLTVNPHLGGIVASPALGHCSKSNRTVPLTCLKQCQISRADVLEHFLTASDKSHRLALPEFVVQCALSGKRLLQDEVEKSGVTGKVVDKALLKTSAISSVRAEPEHFARCEFTKAEVLRDELAVSDISGKKYRQDQRRRSVVSGKAGHKDEFIVCSQTGHSLAPAEAEKCEVTGSPVRPGILEKCAVSGKKVLASQLGQCEVTGKRVLKSELEKCQATGKTVLRSELVSCEASGKRVLPSELQRCDISGKRVLPSELERCAVTNKRALKTLFVTSSVGGARVLEDVAIRSATGKFCTPVEAKQCAWSGRTSHPDDLRTCELTGLPILFQFAGSAKNGHALQSLVELLDGMKRNADKHELWPTLAANASTILRKGRCQVESAILSPTGRHLAASVEVRTMLGFRVHQAGIVFAIDENLVVGRIAQGQRKAGRWAGVHG